MKHSFLAVFAMLPLSAMAQYPIDNPADEAFRTQNLPTLKALKMTAIPGAPILQQPVQLNGTEKEIRTAKHGLAYPALYDWNHDGLPDLLVGEFSTGDRHNNIKVFLNSGTKKKPRFTGDYFYALDTKGDTITNHQWCCIGIHPRLVDVTGDGQLDMLSGQYNPGLVTLWQGTPSGFMPPQVVEQEGYKNPPYNDMNNESPKTNLYWNYTSAGFADYDGDGLVDLFVGGSAGLRVALNTGTKEKPAFGIRKYLLFTDGTPLTVDGRVVRPGYNAKYMKTYPTPVDWDHDGVLDLLVTHEYDREGSVAVSFFRGVKTNLGLRFEKPVPLFTAANGGKALPGCQPMISIGDLNGDGIDDIVMGLSLPTIPVDGQDPRATIDGPGIERKVDQEIADKWISGDLHMQMPGKDAGEYYMYSNYDELFNRVKGSEGDRQYYLGALKDPNYINLRHRGYVYVFYGSKNKEKATPAEMLTVEPPKPVPTTKFSDATSDEPMSYNITTYKDGTGSWDIDITLQFAEGWHGYADDEATEKQGFIPTTVEIVSEDGIFSNLSKPYNGGSNLLFGQQTYRGEIFLTKKMEGTPKVKVKINYQACDDHGCRMPTEHIVEVELKEK